MHLIITKKIYPAPRIPAFPSHEIISNMRSSQPKFGASEVETFGLETQKTLSAQIVLRSYHDCIFEFPPEMLTDSAKNL